MGLLFMNSKQKFHSVICECGPISFILYKENSNIQVKKSFYCTKSFLNIKEIFFSIMNSRYLLFSYLHFKPYNKMYVWSIASKTMVERNSWNLLDCKNDSCNYVLCWLHDTKFYLIWLTSMLSFFQLRWPYLAIKEARITRENNKVLYYKDLLNDSHLTCST
jgi:hypothetical protein